MNQSQEFKTGSEETIPKNAAKLIDENLQLTHSNTNQQMRGNGDSDTAYTAYDAIERHKSFRQSRRSYNERCAERSSYDYYNVYWMSLQ